MQENINKWANINSQELSKETNVQAGLLSNMIKQRKMEESVAWHNEIEM